MKRSGFVANSSSSSFICDTKLTLEQARGILYDMYVLCTRIDKIKYPDGRTPSFSSMFQEPFVVTTLDENCNVYDDSVRYVDYIWDWCGEEKDWRFTSLGIKTKEDLRGKLIINSTNDNSIPHELFEFIEIVFDGYRIHLG